MNETPVPDPSPASVSVPAPETELPGILPPAPEPVKPPVVPVTGETVPIGPPPPAAGAAAPPGASDAAFPWACPDCGSRHEFRSYLQRHIRRSHRERAAELIAKLPGELGERTAPRVEPGRPDFSDIGGNGPAQGSLPLGGPPVPAPVNYDAMALTLFDITTGSLSRFFGPEWQPSSLEEKQAVCGATANYLRSKGLPDIPPGMMLVLVIGMYAAPRFQAVSTRSKLGAAWTWVKVKVFRRKIGRPVSQFTTEGAGDGSR